jgi:hypothetical protein
MLLGAAMAQRTIVQLTDDLDGTELNEGSGRTVRFALDGTAYEIDLSNKNAEKFEKVLKPYLEAARKAGAGPRRGRRSGNSTRDYVPAEVRAWAQSNNISVPERGRIPVDVLDQYRSAN